MTPPSPPSPPTPPTPEHVRRRRQQQRDTWLKTIHSWVTYLNKFSNDRFMLKLTNVLNDSKIDLEKRYTVCSSLYEIQQSILSLTESGNEPNNLFREKLIEAVISENSKFFSALLCDHATRTRTWGMWLSMDYYSPMQKDMLNIAKAEIESHALQSRNSTGR